MSTGPNAERTEALAFDGKYLFAALYTGDGVYRSPDLGKTWQRTNPLAHLPSCNFIAIDPRDSKEIFLGTGQGLYQSKNEGSSWNLIQPTSGVSVVYVSIDASKTPSRVYLAGSAGAWISKDGGTTWNSLGLVVSGTTLNVVEVDPRDPKHLIVGEHGLWSSSDGGRSFSPLRLPFSDLAFSVAFDSASPRIYASFYHEGMLRSMDGGGTWAPINNGLTGRSLLTRNVLMDARHPGRLIRASFGTGVYVSERYGDSWTDITGNLPSSQVNWIILVKHRLFAATVAGLFVTDLR